MPRANIDLSFLFGGIKGNNTPEKNLAYGAKGPGDVDPSYKGDPSQLIQDQGTQNFYQQPSFGMRVFNPEMANKVNAFNMELAGQPIQNQMQLQYQNAAAIQKHDLDQKYAMERSSAFMQNHPELAGTFGNAAQLNNDYQMGITSPSIAGDWRRAAKGNDMQLPEWAAQNDKTTLERTYADNLAKQAGGFDASLMAAQQTGNNLQSTIAGDAMRRFPNTAKIGDLQDSLNMTNLTGANQRAPLNNLAQLGSSYLTANDVNRNLGNLAMLNDTANTGEQMQNIVAHNPGINLKGAGYDYSMNNGTLTPSYAPGMEGMMAKRMDSMSMPKLPSGQPITAINGNPIGAMQTHSAFGYQQQNLPATSNVNPTVAPTATQAAQAAQSSIRKPVGISDPSVFNKQVAPTRADSLKQTQQQAGAAAVQMKITELQNKLKAGIQTGRGTGGLRSQAEYQAAYDELTKLMNQ